MRQLLYSCPIILIVFILISSCKDNSTSSEPPQSNLIGIWEVKGDSMIIWQGNSISGTDNISTDPNDYHIGFKYVKPHVDRPDIPRVNFTLVDSSITSQDYNNLDIHNIDHYINVPSSFTLISSAYKARGFNGTLAFYRYSNLHEVDCEENSSTNELTYYFYNKGNLERTYIFDTNEIEEAIKKIACNK